MTESANKTAFITGASSGIGAEFARQLAGSGYDLVITARRADRLYQLADSIRSANPVTVTVQPADISKMPDIELLVSVISNLSDLDILVNNAGFGTVGRFYRVDSPKQLAMLNVHMIAPVMLSRAALPIMLSNNHGSIINVSSLAGLIPIRNVIYQSTKSFLINFSAGLQTELMGSQVHVQALCPGFVYTEFHDTPEYSRFSRNSVPRFLWMTPSQVVSASLKSLHRSQLVCIPGTLYQFAGLLARNSITMGLIRAAAILILRNRKTFINP